MPIDSSIYSQVGQGQQQPVNPLAQLAQVEQIRRYQRQGEQEDRTNALMDRRNALLSSPDFQGGDATKRANLLYGAGDIEGAGKVTTTAAAAEKDQREGQKFQLEAAFKKMDAISQIMGPVKDQATYDIARQQAVQIFGPEAAANIPPVYDPAQVAQKQQQALSMKERLDQQYKALTAGETQRHNLASEGTSARTAATGEGQLAVSQGNLATRQQELAAGKVPSGYERGPDGALRPQAGGPHDPAGKGFKLTEDQGKATGWLVQAEQAFKNMDAVGFKNGKATDAATPGFGDAVAAIPGMGGAGNWLRSDNRQKFVQGASSLSEALLRAATGAGVNKDEAKQKIQELTPQWGDSDAVIEQKRAGIPLYIESLKVRAGPGAAQAAQIPGKTGGASGSWEPPAGKTVKRTGMLNGRKVVQYTDGSTEYAN